MTDDWDFCDDNTKINYSIIKELNDIKQENQLILENQEKIIEELKNIKNDLYKNNQNDICNNNQVRSTNRAWRLYGNIHSPLYLSNLLDINSNDSENVNHKMEKD